MPKLTMANPSMRQRRRAALNDRVCFACQHLLPTEQGNGIALLGCVCCRVYDMDTDDSSLVDHSDSATGVPGQFVVRGPAGP